MVRLLATFKHRGSLYLLFNWADGGNLRDLWMSNPDPNDPLVPIWMADQCLGLVKALHVMHTHAVDGMNTTGYRHGDLKPENILCFRLSSNGPAKLQQWNLRISDFGSTRIQARQPTRPSRLTGTATYRPPECDLTDGRISASYDIWTLGCLFLEFTTWYLTGCDGVINEFPRSRSQEMPQKGFMSVEDDSFFTIDSDGETSLLPTLKLSVREVRRAMSYSTPSSGREARC